jgi:hypothetical protein
MLLGLLLSGCRPDPLTDGGIKTWTFVTPGWRDTTGRSAPVGAFTIGADGRFTKQEDTTLADSEGGHWSRRGDTLVLQFEGSQVGHRFVIRQLTPEALLLDDGMGDSLRLQSRHTP